MNFKETVDYLYAALPFFQRDGAKAVTKDLQNTRLVCNFLENPERKFISIHIAGTNGKGSVSHYLASVLQQAGYRVGLYTSPHLKKFTERIKINGAEVEESFVIEFTQKLRPLIEQIKPSFFEITVGMAFDYFAHKQVDIAVIETGMGGRLDSTNIITPVLSIITNISFDHKDFLGDTLPLIAAEKAGIIKPGVPVVIGETHELTRPVFEQTAQRVAAPYLFADDTYTARWEIEHKTVSIFKNQHPYLLNIDSGLYGSYQLKNLCTVMASLELLRQSSFKLDNAVISKGIGNVVSNTGLKGRWQVLALEPYTVCDTGHNEAGIAEVVSMLQATGKKLHLVLGMMKDKDRSAIVRLLPHDASFYFCQPDNPRAAPAALLAQELKDYHPGASVYTGSGVNETLAYARQKAKNDELIFIGGSTFVVAELNDL